MEVRGLNSARPATPINRPEITPVPEESAPAGPTSPKDEVQISEMGKMLDDASRTSGVREQRLAQIKAAIDAGTYDTPEKLAIAVNRMLETLKMDEH